MIVAGFRHGPLRFRWQALGHDPLDTSAEVQLKEAFHGGVDGRAVAGGEQVQEQAAGDGDAEPGVHLGLVAGNADDAVIRGAGDVRVVVDPKSVPIVAGSTLDLDTALLGGGLKVRNPQAIHECSCGESFGI